MSDVDKEYYIIECIYEDYPSFKSSRCKLFCYVVLHVQVYI